MRRDGKNYIRLTDREIATILCALRRFQEGYMNGATPNTCGDCFHFEDDRPLTIGEIDRLCEEINS